MGGCLYLDTLVGEVSEVHRCVRKEGRATFSQGLVGFHVVSGNKAKDIKQPSVTSKTSQGIYSLLHSLWETCARENVAMPLGRHAAQVSVVYGGQSRACAAVMQPALLRAPVAAAAAPAWG